MQDILSAIGNVGFPMAVTAFLLVRIEAKLGQLNDSILLLTRTLAQKSQPNQAAVRPQAMNLQPGRGLQAGRLRRKMGCDTMRQKGGMGL